MHGVAWRGVRRVLQLADDAHSSPSPMAAPSHPPFPPRSSPGPPHPFSCQTVHDNRLYEVRVHCGDRYPDQPPLVRFVSRINMPCVDPDSGEVVSIARHSIEPSTPRSWLTRRNALRFPQPPPTIPRRTAAVEAADPGQLAAALHHRAGAAGAAAGDGLAGQPPAAAATRGLALLAGGRGRARAPCLCVCLSGGVCVLA